MILDGRTDELMTDIYTRQLVESLMWEVVAGAKITGIIIPESFI